MALSIAILCAGLFLSYFLWGAKLGVWTGQTSQQSLNQVQDLFFRTVFTLLGYVAKRDGPVNKLEVQRTEVYMEKMDLNAEQKREAIRLFKLGADVNFDADATVKEFYGLAKKSPNLVQILLVYLISLARVDGLLGTRETDAVQKIAAGLGYSSVTFKHLLEMISSQYNFTEGMKKKTQAAKPQGECKANDDAGGASVNQCSGQNKANQTDSDEGQTQNVFDMTDGESCAEKTEDFNTRDDQLDEAFKVLGLSRNASDVEIKKAYRNLIGQYHPDKLMGLGLPSYMIQSSTECFQAIQSAYEYIKEARAK
ncbi:MAG: co-chaperone DjlA [Gammaproteobacteria bacterium]|nr:MAG: co-chaperone DjlA [Gammaproteobacteria bacterium]